MTFYFLSFAITNNRKLECLFAQIRMFELLGWFNVSGVDGDL